MRVSTRQEQALRKKRHWQEAHGSQQAGAGGLQLSRVATQGAGCRRRGRATFVIEAFFLEDLFFFSASFLLIFLDFLFNAMIETEGESNRFMEELFLRLLSSLGFSSGDRWL